MLCRVVLRVSCCVVVQWFIRIFSLGAIIVLYIWVFAVAWNDVEPSEEVLLEYE
jgi:hypothetical protein